MSPSGIRPFTFKKELAKAKGLSHLFLLLSISATAAPTAPLTWQACLEQASAHNLQLQAGKLDVEKAKYAIDASKAAFLPQITANADLTRNYTDRDGISTFSNEQSLPPLSNLNVEKSEAGQLANPWAFSNQYSYGLTIKQSLFSGFRNQATEEKRRMEAEVAAAELNKIKAQVGYDLRVAYVSLLYAQELAELQRRVSRRQQENVRLVSLRFQGGRENKGSLMKSQAALKQADADIAQAEGMLRVAQTKLAKGLGISQWKDVRVAGDFVLPGVSEPGDWAALAQAHPARQAADAGIRAAQAGLKNAYGQEYPDISAFASATRSGSWSPASNRVAVGLSLSLPIYSGGTTSAEIQSAAVDVAKANANRQISDMDTLVDLQTAFAQLKDSILRVAVSEETLKAVQLQSEIAKNQYSLGLITFQDWDQLEENLSSAERSLLANRQEALLNEASWQKALGTNLFQGT